MDLGSVVAGVVVVGVLSLGTSAIVFGAIPWSQDNAAQQKLASASSAQTVAVNKTGKFLPAAELESGGFIQKTGRFAAAANGEGDCFVGVVTSDSGKVFYNTNKVTTPAPLTAGTKLPCLTGHELQSLVKASGGTTDITPDTYYAWGWGSNDQGQAGTGDPLTLSYRVPTAIPTTDMVAPPVITAVSAGTTHSCAVTTASKIYCWGDGYYYKLGQGTTTDYPQPIQVIDSLLAGKTITSLSAGFIHNCIIADAQGYCWGNNGYGQFGTGTTTSSGRPVLIPAFAGKTVTSITAGFFSTCAAVDGEAYCWGYNPTGRIGDGTTTTSYVPVKVAGLLVGKAVTEVSMGRNHSCAVANNEVYCWGANTNGQLGNGGTTASLVPVKVTGLPAGKTLKGLSSGAAHSCVIAEGTIYCWGSNVAGQLGIGTNTDSTKAMPVNGLLRGKAVTMVSAGMDDSANGAGSHTCAIAAGTAYCWGSNANGEVGNNSTTASFNVPMKPGTTSTRKITAISAGGKHTSSISVPVVP